MNTLQISILVAVVIVLGGISWIIASNQKSNEAMMEKDGGDTMMEKKDDQMMKDGTTESATSDAMMKKDEDVMTDQVEGETMMKKDGDATMEKESDGTMMDKPADGAMMMKSGSYEPYAASKVSLASTAHDVVLFFRAGWCPTCRAVDADIRANLTAIPASLTILDVNYDSATDLKKKYGVTYQHTFVQVDSEGNLIKKWSGSPTLSALVAEVK